MPIIENAKCDGCGRCVSICHCGALALIDNLIQVIETVECDWCAECEAVCSNRAISCPFEIVIEDH